MLPNDCKVLQVHIYDEKKSPLLPDWPICETLRLNRDVGLNTPSLPPPQKHIQKKNNVHIYFCWLQREKEWRRKTCNTQLLESTKAKQHFVRLLYYLLFFIFIVFFCPWLLFAAWKIVFTSVTKVAHIHIHYNN